MSNYDPDRSNDSKRRHFRRQWFRFLIPCVFAGVAFGMFAYNVNGGAWYAVPGFCLIAALAAALHGGLLVTTDGIEWYAIHPRLRFRRVPWSAVLEARPGPLGPGHSVRLTLADRRYEPWIWGTPKPGGQRVFVIHTKGFTDGAAVLDAIQNAWLPHRRVSEPDPIG